MSFSLFVLIFALGSVTVSGLLTCQQVDVEDCLRPFKKDFDAGVEPLKTANESMIAQVCWRHDLVSKCLIPIVFYCPEVQDQLQKKLEAFEYFCYNIARHSEEGWPFKPTLHPDQRDYLIESAEAEKKRQKTIDSAIKASVAAGVTVFLILLCVIFDCVSRLRVRRRVQKAVAASVAAQEHLLQKEAAAMDSSPEDEKSPVVPAVKKV